MKTPQQQAYEKVTKDFLKLIPPQGHKFSLNNGPGFLGNLRNTVAKYVPKISVSSLTSYGSDFFNPPFRQPLYGEFLIYAKTLHNQEPLGTYLFTFKQHDSVGTNVDIIFSAASLFKVSGLGEDVAPNTYRLANVWYGLDSDVAQPVPNLQDLIENGDFHRYLTPVGPLVQNLNSTFLNKIVSVTRGEVLTKQMPQENVKLLIPADLFFDLDENLPHLMHNEPRHLKVFYYACVTYVMVLNRPALSLAFFRSGKSFCEVMIQLKNYYSDVLANKMTQSQGQLDIKRTTFGAMCKIGYSSSQSLPAHKTLQVRGSAFNTIEVSGFVSDPGVWVQLV
ncbi:capsid protein [Harp seal herpesvirus]|uniref:Capsid protein n=1 Tax=phocid gammaherpesvirus 3 TaxID=2560643 RepID=A0A0R5YYF2_9GAMA|nr:capsid protein [Harp seal herpesvirus]AJG42989.1 capsid protein [Harp seal herpesvirus]